MSRRNSKVSLRNIFKDDSKPTIDLYNSENRWNKPYRHPNHFYNDYSPRQYALKKGLNLLSPEYQINSARNDGSLYFPNMQRAEERAKGIRVATRPMVGQSLIYSERGGPTVNVVLTKGLHRYEGDKYRSGTIVYEAQLEDGTLIYPHNAMRQYEWEFFERVRGGTRNAKKGRKACRKTSRKSKASRSKAH